MKEILTRIETWFKKHLPEVLDSLNPAATEEEILELENQMQFELPPSFKELYKWHNGQMSRYYPGLFYGLEFLSLPEIHRNWQVWAQLVDEGINKDILGQSHSPGKVKEIYASKKWIPFAYDCGGNHLGIDLDPGKKGKVGQVINFGRDEDVKFVFADDLESFLNWFITQLESGNYIISSEDEDSISFSTKNPEMSHFLDYWKVITQGKL
ncbi:SMI1/KNR4 family protein [Nostocaceae cyanobacterium CENA369]|uniref:SMI1/KNR4 family protein n=1 Tax=Dendronalium phyllosphericum CENA369 TaxID=1725256 RepID=A0A8J7LE10_9NOST|nr:SMI1/KNR4 family protein [Dendronalium phyllosphericum]MBH8573671.1 SMI1/KNR4 family protein [Dendronalium phyllosphericum CENA369]